DLATAYHETAHTMQPITERGRRSYFNKYEPGTRIGKRLGNTVKGDGYRFRGEGHVQNTGRANAIKATRRINQVYNLGVDLVANPGQRGDPFVSAVSLFLGNREGWWTGKRLGQYLKPGSIDYRNARRVVNGTDAAAKIKGHAQAFESALLAAGYGHREHAAHTAEKAAEKAVEHVSPVATGDVPEPPQSAPAKPGGGASGILVKLLVLAVLAALAWLAFGNPGGTP
ncbi:MAG: hypothetical protein KDJ43_10325, partial [Rhizobiaceae bacterium]|nr:hypothetical protein [Rhizobiaceae bacterium]